MNFGIGRHLHAEQAARRRSRLQRQRIVACVICAVLFEILAASQALAGPRKQPNGLTWDQLALLPKYCRDANGIVYGDRYYNTSPNAAHWEALMGMDFWHIHHYCYALAEVSQANRTQDVQRKKYLLIKARDNYRYVIDNCQPTMVLMPEIWTHMGDVQYMLGDMRAAMNAYETAMARKPDYWPAYKNAAEMLLRAGDKPKALQILQRGIEADPSSMALRNSYRAAGGDPVNLPPLPSSASSKSNR